MISAIKTLSKKAGIDKAIGYSVLSRVLQAGGGVISILFISRYLNKVEQGYYYTFGSLTAIQIFFELGFTQVITQFVAHEAAQLEWNEDSFTGSEHASSRLSSLLHFSIKWFCAMAILLCIVLVITGYIFFTKFEQEAGDVNWYAPFIILSVATAGTLLSTPILAFLEGLGKVKEVAIIRFFQQAGYLALLFSFFIFGFKLYAAPVAQLINFVLPLILVACSRNVKLLKRIFYKKGDWVVHYRREIFPYQFRIAISWMSGFFTFQLFNPVLFATDGAVVAGQMGMTMSVLNGIMATSYTWFNTKTPLFSGLIAKLKFKELDTVFNQTLKQATFICCSALLVFILTIAVLKYFDFAIADRFLDLPALILVCSATLGNQISYGMATYLRCHKQEPLMVQAVIIGLLMIISIIVFGKLFGVIGITSAYCFLTTFVGVTWTYQTFKSKKEQWHQIVL